MASAVPELSSIASGLDELTKRMTSLADRLNAEKSDIAPELYEVERTLLAAHRRLEKLVPPGQNARS